LLIAPPALAGSIIPIVTLERLAGDTSADVERLQIERWRQMSPAEKAAIITGLTQAAHDLALAGVRQRYPTATPREHFLRLAVLLLGPDLARKAYPDVSELDGA
jgi:hypothetical protein